MAKKPQIENDLFKRTDQAGSETHEATGPTITKGVGLKESEWAELQDVADELGQTQHAITAYAVRYFLKQYRTGEIQPENKPTLPGL